MAQITFKANAVQTSGELPGQGSATPDFKLVRQNLSEASLATYEGKTKVLNIFPSIDTGICAKSVKAFHAQAADIPDVVVLNISADLPFAAKRFCGAEGVETAETLSTFRSGFAKDYGVLMADGPMEGLLARAVIVVDAKNNVVYSELVPEIVQEPNYDAALAAAKG